MRCGIVARYAQAQNETAHLHATPAHSDAILQFYAVPTPSPEPQALAELQSIDVASFHFSKSLPPPHHHL